MFLNQDSKVANFFWQAGIWWTRIDSRSSGVRVACTDALGSLRGHWGMPEHACGAPIAPMHPYRRHAPRSFWNQSQPVESRPAKKLATSSEIPNLIKNNLYIFDFVKFSRFSIFRNFHWKSNEKIRPKKSENNFRRFFSTIRANNTLGFFLWSSQLVNP